MGMTAARQRERRALQGSAPIPLPSLTTEQRLEERGAECARLRSENIALRKRIDELEHQVAHTTVAQVNATEQPRQQQAPQPQRQQQKLQRR